MQAKFHNKTTMDKKTCKDFLSLTWPQNAGMLRYVLLGAAVASFGYAVFQLFILGLAAVGYAIGLFLMGGVALFMGQFGYYTRLGMYTKRQQQAWGAEQFEKEVNFYDTSMEQVYQGRSLAFTYDKITKILQNKNCIVFCFGQEALLVKRQGFKDGEDEKCINFINEKIKK